MTCSQKRREKKKKKREKRKRNCQTRKKAIANMLVKYTQKSNLRY